MYDDNDNYDCDKTEVKVYTSGTDFWRNIQDFPFGFVLIDVSGKFVSGRINWLASTTGYQQSPFCIFFFF